jgi:hypothetical protein
MDALRLKALQTYQRTKNIVLERSAPVRQRGEALWAVYKPTSYVQWTAFAGLLFLAAAAAASALIILLGILIVLSWVGVVVGSVVLAGCTLGSFVLGAGNLFFSGTCAAIGASILSCAAFAYSLVYAFERAKAYWTLHHGLAPASAPYANMKPMTHPYSAPSPVSISNSAYTGKGVQGSAAMAPAAGKYQPAYKEETVVRRPSAMA